MTENTTTHCKLGKTKTEIHIKNVEENRNAVIALTRQARHNINIFTQDFDAPLYDNEELEKHLFELTTRYRNAEIKILVQDSTSAVRNSHRLVRLAQKLTSTIQVKNPSARYKDVQSAFLTVDGIGMLYRVQGNSRNYEASANFMSPQKTGELDNFFTEIWEHSEIDIQIRRIFM